jgi:hypothetical protein
LKLFGAGELKCAPFSQPLLLHRVFHEGLGTRPWHEAMRATGDNWNASQSLRRLGREIKRMTVDSKGSYIVGSAEPWKSVRFRDNVKGKGGVFALPWHKIRQAKSPPPRLSIHPLFKLLYFSSAACRRQLELI